MTDSALAPPEKCTARMPRWIVWCAFGAFLTAMPTTIWRAFLGAGFPLGTPAEWREFQEIPGSGTWYVLGLSAFQLMAAVACLALAVDVRRLTPTWAPNGLRHRAALIGGVSGLTGAAILAVAVVMSAIAWDRVDPFAGVVYGTWGWLCFWCYLVTALWPIFLAAASIGYLSRSGRA